MAPSLAMKTIMAVGTNNFARYRAEQMMSNLMSQMACRAHTLPPCVRLVPCQTKPKPKPGDIPLPTNSNGAVLFLYRLPSKTISAGFHVYNRLHRTHANRRGES